MKKQVWLVTLLCAGFVFGGCTARLAQHKAEGRKPMGQLIAQLQRGNLNQKLDSLEELERHGAGAVAALPQLKRLVRHPDPRLRRATIHPLKEVGVKALPLMLQLDRDEIPTIRKEARHKLVIMAPVWLTALTKELASWSQARRLQVAEILAQAGPRVQAATPALVKMLQQKEVDDKKAAAKAIGFVGMTPAASKALCKTFEENQIWWSLRVEIASAFARQGRRSADALPTLVRAGFQDKDKNVKRAVVQAILAMGKAALPGIRQMLQKDTWEDRAIATRLIAIMGTKAIALLPDLLNTLQDSDTTVQKEAMNALVKLDKDSPKVLNSLKQVITTKSNAQSAKIAAIDALVKLGPSGIKTLLILHKDETLPERPVIAARLKQAGIDVNAKDQQDIVNLFHKIPSK